jgi:hypothetical protein|tara:strand:- start:897 stop:1109 length:213 start_codon:yes stop_codon:yes gene_type:complete
MQKDVWYNGQWNNLSGSYAEFKTAYKSLTGFTWSREETDDGIFGGYYDGATYPHAAGGEVGPPTGSKWNV